MGNRHGSLGIGTVLFTVVVVCHEAALRPQDHGSSGDLPRADTVDVLLTRHLDAVAAYRQAFAASDA